MLDVENFVTVRLASSNTKLTLLPPVKKNYVPQVRHLQARGNILIIRQEREEKWIVRSKFYIHLIVFPYELSQLTSPCSENVLFASLYFFL